MKKVIETNEQYIKRMTNTKELFKPTGFISVHTYSYNNKEMLSLEVYTDCIYKPNQPVAQLWITPINAVHLAWELLENSRVWNIYRKKSKNESTS